MSPIKHSRIVDLPARTKAEHEGYAYTRRNFVSRGQAGSTLVSIYELPPGKSAYPYHYHLKDEETFYILSGEGLLRTPQGEKAVSAGDLLFFPAGSEGAHKLTNTSDQPLVYIDFDVTHDLDAAVYPDSGKIGLWGMDVNRVFRLEDSVPYYEGE